MRREREDRIASVAHAGGDRDVDELVGVRGVSRRQQPDGQTAGGPGAARRVLHDAGHPAADQDGPPLGDTLPHLERNVGKGRLRV